MMSSLQQEFLKLTQTEGLISEASAEAIYDKLEPVNQDFMIGQWVGHSLNTGHSTHALLKDHNWAGKDFRGTNDVDPIMLHDQDGNRVWAKEYGHARLREINFHGKVSTAMIYDKFPIIDVFRFVDKETVMGAMDNKDLREEGIYYFYLTRM